MSALNAGLAACTFRASTGWCVVANVCVGYGCAETIVVRSHKQKDVEAKTMAQPDPQVITELQTHLDLTKRKMKVLETKVKEALGRLKRSLEKDTDIKLEFEKYEANDVKEALRSSAAGLLFKSHGRLSKSATSLLAPFLLGPFRGQQF